MRLNIIRGRDRSIPLCVEYRRQFHRLIQDLTEFFKKYEKFYDPIRVQLKQIVTNAIFVSQIDTTHCCRFIEIYEGLVVGIEDFIAGLEITMKNHLETELSGILSGVPRKKNSQLIDKSVNVVLMEDVQSKFVLDSYLSVLVLSNPLLLEKIVDNLDRQTALKARCLNSNWNHFVVSKSAKKLIFEAGCVTGFEVVPKRERTTDEPMCLCNMNFVRSTLTIPFPIRRFKLGVAWEDHLRSLIEFQVVEIDSLQIALPAIGHQIFGMPIPAWFLCRRHRDKFITNEPVRSLPADLQWLDGCLTRISNVLSPARFQNLKELNVCLTAVEFYGMHNSTFETNFYRSATTCLENVTGLNYELVCLEKCVIATEEYDHQLVFSELPFHVALRTFLVTLGSLMVENVCGAAPNLRHLDIGRWFVHQNNRNLFHSTIDTCNLPKLQYLDMCNTIQSQVEINSIVQMFRRCKEGNANFTLSVLYIEFNKNNSNQIWDASDLFSCVADSVKDLKILCPVKPTMPNITRFPIMNNVTTFICNWYTVKHFPGLDFEVIMPNLKTTTILLDFVENEEVNCHQFVPRFFNGEMSVIPEDLLVSPFDVSVSSSSLRTLVLNHDSNVTHSICNNVPIKFNFPQITSLSLNNTGCVTWFLSLVKQFPLLIELDIKVDSFKTCCDDDDDDHSYIDFIFTGLPFQQVYTSKNGIGSLEHMVSLIPSELISMDDRRDCLLHCTGLQHLTVRHTPNEDPDDRNVISDWAGYHGFALMTHLKSFTFESEFIPTNGQSGFNHVLSETCMEYVRKALEPKTTVIFRGIEKKDVFINGRDPHFLDLDPLANHQHNYHDY